jgi:hypothetical protein
MRNSRKKERAGCLLINRDASHGCTHEVLEEVAPAPTFLVNFSAQPNKTSLSHGSWERNMKASNLLPGFPP